MPDDDYTPAFGRFSQSLFKVIDAPVTFFKENVVDRFRGEKQVYYHRRFRRVPDVDQCDVDDNVCFYEANEQYKRDKKVDEQIVSILRQKRIECEIYYGPADAPSRCTQLVQDYEQAATNYFIKYGDMGAAATVRQAYIKQKHRAIWERRHGEVGTGTNPKEEWGQ